MHGTLEAGLPKLMAQHMQDPGAFVVEVSIEQLETVVVVNIVDDRTAVIAIFFEIAILETEHGLFEVVSALIMLAPEVFEVGGEAFVQPAIGPVAAGEQVAKPLVRQFMRYNRHDIDIQRSTLVNE